MIWSLVWCFLVIGVHPTVSKFYFFLERKKNNWVFLYWKTIFNFAKEDLMWWFWRATSWVLTHSIQLSWSSGATGIAREIKLTLKILMIQTLVFSANLTKIDKFFLICLIYFLYNSYIWYIRGSGISNNIARFSIPWVYLVANCRVISWLLAQNDEQQQY